MERPGDSVLGVLVGAGGDETGVRRRRWCAYDGVTAFLAAGFAFLLVIVARGAHGGSSAARDGLVARRPLRAALRGRARERLG